jgi:hypothetical protein
MFRAAIISGVVTLLLPCFTSQSLRADCPTEKTIVYRVYKDPGQENSPVYLTFEMHVYREAQTNNNVGWRADQLQIKLWDDNGNPMHVWTDETPEFQTTDGLWWVAHADPCEPLSTEFILPPALEGSAETGSTEVDDLDYAVEGTNPALPRPSFFTPTTYLTYIVTLANETTPLDEEDDEPVETPESSGDPG